MRKLFSLFGLAALIAVTPFKASAAVISLGQVIYPVASIASSGTTSQALMTNGMSLVGCQIPASFTGTAITFTTATTLSGTYQPLYNSSGQVSYTVAQGEFIAIKPEDFYGLQFFKIVSNATESSARSLVCSMKGI